MRWCPEIRKYRAGTTNASLVLNGAMGIATPTFKVFHGPMQNQFKIWRGPAMADNKLQELKHDEEERH
jgi:hypothetical protein